jgi:hypothetical protein
MAMTPRLGTDHRTERESVLPHDETFDAAFDRLLKGPAGVELRRAHILEQFATRLYDGDFEKARVAIDTPHPRLAGRCPSELAETYDEMLTVKRLLPRSGNPQSRATTGLGAFLESVKQGWRDEFEPLVDLLQAAWALNEDQFAQLFGSSPPTLADWQQERVALSEQQMQRLRRLRRLHEAFRLMVRPQNYPEIWHIVWERGSFIGGRSIWEAYEEDGDAVLDLVEDYFRGAAGL